MKSSLFAAWLALAVTFSMTLVQDGLSTRNESPPRAAPLAAARLGAGREPPQATAAPPKAAPPRMLRVLHGDEPREEALEDYLVGVVAAEMPADFEPEALKAQAVAARSYALYCAESGRHGDRAEVCTDYRCCQAWKSVEEMQSGWGADFERCLAKIKAAVDATAGEHLRYEGQAVFAAFHSSSAGFTEACGAIWSDLPYLVSVPSPEDAERVPNYVSVVELSPLDFRDTLLHACPEADFTGGPESWIGDVLRDGSGRVETAVLGGAHYAGTQLRSLFSLRSTAFTLDWDGELFRFTVTGFGHGVGMSQYGAEVMAADGADYAEILAHYYPGTELCGR